MISSPLKRTWYGCHMWYNIDVSANSKALAINYQATPHEHYENTSLTCNVWIASIPRIHVLWVWADVASLLATRVHWCFVVLHLQGLYLLGSVVAAKKLRARCSIWLGALFEKYTLVFWIVTRLVKQEHGRARQHHAQLYRPNDVVLLRSVWVHSWGGNAHTLKHKT